MARTRRALTGRRSLALRLPDPCDPQHAERKEHRRDHEEQLHPDPPGGKVLQGQEAHRCVPVIAEQVPASGFPEPPQLLAQDLIEQMAEPHPRPLQAIRDHEHVRVEILGVDIDGLLRLPGHERRPPRRVAALVPLADAISDAGAPGDLQRLVRPLVERRRDPRPFARPS